MKLNRGLFFGVLLVGLIAIAGWTFGPEPVAAGLAVIALVVIIFTAFSLGNWWSFRLMQAGAHIALQAQVSDDKRDGDLIRSLAEFSRQAKSLPSAELWPKPALQADALRYPPITPPSFVVSGLLADSKPVKEDGDDD